jgi:carbonic anhydrase/acetyltransferase-like protein (isoleucine patch superfamily)
MAIYALGDQVPDVHPDAYIHPDAVVIGDVVIGSESSVWACAVLRGDDGGIRVGARTSIQDCAVLHTTEEWPTVVGDECTIGHLAHLEGCTIHDQALVGNQAVVLHRAIVSSGALIAANAVVLNDVLVPPGALAVGIPAKVKEGVAVDVEDMMRGMQSYVDRGHRYRAELRRID